MQPLEINGPRVVAEVFDEEVVVIHLEKGSYYSLTGSAPQIWPMIGRGEDALCIARRVAACVGSEVRADVEASVLAFLRELVDEELLRSCQNTGSKSAAGTEVPVIDAFSPPRIEKFTDMQELIALDPVHDVTDSEGWPTTPILTPRTE